MKNLIYRNTPVIADAFELRDIESAGGKNTYEVFCENGKIVICGDCKISQAMGYYAYLKKYCGVNLSHCGNTSLNVTEAPLFEGKLSKIIVQDKRAYLNYRTFAFSTAYWKWEEWEKEIDFMAMNGINMPLSLVGSEAVLYYTMRDFKYSETGALSYLSGPGYWPWQLMSDIAAFFALTDVKYIESRVELGKKIIDREVDLGMTPIMQGFSGSVPQTFTKLFKKLRLQIVPPWRNFPFTYRLEPTNPIFRKFGMALLEKQRQLFGAYHYYICEPFNENGNFTKSRNFYWNIGRAIDTLYRDFDPESKWVMQSTYICEKTVKSVPKERLLILDINGKGHSETDEFWGYDFILGTAVNYGDRTSLGGNIKALAENAYLDAPENCIGTGIFAEGIMQNPLYFELAFDMLTQDGKTDLDKWCEDYAFRRYGSDEKCLSDCVKLLAKSCYGENCGEYGTGSVICARPCTDLKHTAPFDSIELKYENNTLFKAAELLLSSSESTNDGYEYDVCDITRQLLSNRANQLYRKTMDGFRRRDVSIFERSSNGFLKICDELDELLQTRAEFSLASHLKEAREAGFTDKEKQNFELNLLAQVTIFGPVGTSINYDYAWKEWGGLIKTFYSKRWQSFFELLAYRFPKRGKFSTKTRKQFLDRNAYRGNALYKNYFEFERKWLSSANPEPAVDGGTKEIAARLIEKYKNQINE